MNKLLFELLISPLSVSDNYYLNYIIITIAGVIAFNVAFKVVGDIGIRGGFGSLLHWTIRLFVFVFLFRICSLVISIIKFIIAHVVLILSICTGCIAIYFLVRKIYKCVFN